MIQEFPHTTAKESNSFEASNILVEEEEQARERMEDTEKGGKLIRIYLICYRFYFNFNFYIYIILYFKKLQTLAFNYICPCEKYYFLVYHWSFLADVRPLLPKYYPRTQNWL